MQCRVGGQQRNLNCWPRSAVLSGDRWYSNLRHLRNQNNGSLIIVLQACGEGSRIARLCATATDRISKSTATVWATYVNLARWLGRPSRTGCLYCSRRMILYLRSVAITGAWPLQLGRKLIVSNVVDRIVMDIPKCKGTSRGCCSVRNQQGRAPAECEANQNKQQQHAYWLCKALMPAGRCAGYTIKH